MSYQSTEDAYQSGYGAGASNYGGNVLYPLTEKGIANFGVAFFLFAVYMAFAHPEALHFDDGNYRTVYGGFLLYAAFNILRYGMYFWYRWRWNRYYKIGTASFCVRHYRWVGWLYTLIPRNPIFTILALICIIWKRQEMFNPALWIGHMGFAELVGTALAGFLFLKAFIFIMQVMFRGD